jgi:hypothetical protein
MHVVTKAKSQVAAALSPEFVQKKLQLKRAIMTGQEKEWLGETWFSYKKPKWEIPAEIMLEVRGLNNKETT